jgi:ABC-2 type transport system permease protein
MVPLEVFGEPLRTIAQFTPHSWAIQGFRALAFDGAGPAGIAVQLAVLLAFGLVPLAVATWRFRRMLAGG